MKTGKIILAIAMFSFLSVVACFAAEQKTFATAGEAVKALMAAVESNNEDELMAMAGCGPGPCPND